MGAPAEIASRENGKLGGRPLSPATIASANMREKIVLEVQKNFTKLVKPQISKALEGEYTAYKDLMDRANVKPLEGPQVAVQVNLHGDRDEFKA